MTSQEDKTSKEVLINKAKELGIKSPHLYGEEKLLTKIAEAQGRPQETVAETEEQVQEAVIVEAPKRKVAPRMNVSGINENTRTKRINELEAQNPEFKYITKKAGTTAEQLAAIGLESTGEYIKNDLVCRTMKDSFVEWQDNKKDAQRRLMDSIDTEGSRIKSHTAQAKVPVGDDK